MGLTVYNATVVDRLFNSLRGTVIILLGQIIIPRRHSVVASGNLQTSR